VEFIFPELVSTDTDGYKSVAYDKLTPILVEAIKEQNTQVKKLENENKDLRIMLQDLQQEIQLIKEVLKK